MSGTSWYELLPLWAVGAITLLVAFASMAMGRRWSLRRRARGVHEDHRAAGVIVGATLSLFAFLLAFTFGLAADRYEHRKSMVLGEAKAIGAAYAHADLLPQPVRGELQALVVAYVNARLSPDDDDDLGNGRSDRLRKRLWARTATYARTAASPHDAQLVSAINVVLDYHTARLHEGRRDRVPSSIWLVLWLVTVLAMGSVGYQTGLVDTRRSPLAWLLVLAFSSVTLLIADLDRPREGLLRLSDRALRDVAATLHPTP
jgi:hypothetical protein